MAERPRHKNITAARGPAVGKITGINHIVLFTHDMDASIRFYRDLLGLKIVRTQPRFWTNALGLQEKALMSAGILRSEAEVKFSVRQVFFQMGNGELFSLYEAKEVKQRPDASIVSFLWPTVDTSPPNHPQKMDHIAFNVETRRDLEWFRDHLRTNGVAVSDVVERRGSDRSHRFLLSIYFSDPSNNPLEMATFDWGDPAWRDYDFTEWYRDEEPAPALLDESGSRQ